METTVNLDCVRPERVAGYGTNYVGEGWVERVKGSPIREHKLRATVPLNDDVARKAVDWMVENPGNAYPFSFTEVNRITGVEVVGGQPARV